MNYKHKLLIFIGLICHMTLFCKPIQEKMTVGIVRSGNTTGDRYEKGIEHVIREQGIDSNQIEFISKKYITSFEGEQIIETLILNNLVDVILGPTESDVYSRVKKKLDKNKNNISVISGTVTASDENTENGYFFKLNLDVRERVLAMWRYINKYWISSVTVIYENTEFGRSAETSFKEAIPRLDDMGKYNSIPFDPNSQEPWYRMVKENILAERPEIIGLFCERDYVEAFYNEILYDNHSGVSYNPKFFSIIDIVKSSEKLDNFYFPSLKFYDDSTTVTKIGDQDEVFLLGKQTAKLLLAAIPTDYDLKSNKSRQDFRDRFVNLIKYNEPNDQNEAQKGFWGLMNKQTPFIYAITDNIIQQKSIDENIHWLKQFWYKNKMVFSVYNNYIYLNIFLIVILTILISQSDIRRSLPKKHVRIYKSYAFYLFVIFHLVLIGFLYIYLTETRYIKHTDTFMVVLISMAPSAILKTTLLETSQGKSIGLEKIYNHFTDFIDDKIMNSRYKNIEALVNIITYNNSESTMTAALLRVYKNNRSKERTAKLIFELEDLNNKEPNYIERRRITAKLLIRQFTKQELKAQGFIPFDWDTQNPINPLVLIRFMAKHCCESEVLTKKIDTVYNAVIKRLEQKQIEGADEILSVHNEEKKLTNNIKGEVIDKLRLIVIYNGFNKKKLIELGFLTEEIFNKINRLKGKNDISI